MAGERIRRALVSVSDKTGLAELGQTLARLGVEILSTGGTARALAAAGVPVREVSEHTGAPEIMDGRVKTLHPRIHGGLLGRRGIDDGVMSEHGIEPIDLLVVNLYPFEQVVAEPGCDLARALENIDIGGPAMIRAAAKNHRSVAVVVDPADYPALIEELEGGGGVLGDETRFRLAVKAFARTARYDGAIAAWLSSQPGPAGGEPARFPGVYTPQFEKVLDLRYGENPHQGAAFYRDAGTPAGPNVAGARLVQGKPLSYNNVADADAALECVKSFPPGEDGPACVIVKHANPSGVAVAPTLAEAYEAAFRTDPTSAFGGIIALNGPLDEELARRILERQFVEVLIAPSVTEAARPVLAGKANVRVLETGPWDGPSPPGLDYKRVVGGLLVQDRDEGRVGPDELRVVTRRAPTEGEWADLLFAWKVVKFVKSNAIVYARDRATIGVGAGQMSRVYSARIAALKAADEGLEVRGSVMASDAFFPFRDGIDTAAEAGITAVIQPGGSVRDEEVIAAADGHGMAMVFTGMRHFRH